MKELLEAKQQLHNLTEKIDFCIQYRFHPQFTKSLRICEPQYHFFWEKYNTDKDQYQKDFLRISVKYAKLLASSIDNFRELDELVDPWRNKQDKTCQKIRELENKYSDSNEILKEKCKLREEMNAITDMIKQGARKYMEYAHQKSTAENKFLQYWIRYTADPRFEQAFLDSSNEYVKRCIEFITVKMEYFDWRQRSTYDARIDEIAKRFAELDGQ